MTDLSLMPLELENLQVLRLVQAMLGALSPNFKAVFISCGDGVVLRFVLGEDRAEDREEVDDIVLEFEALQDGAINVDADIVVSDRPVYELNLTGRPVFLAKS